MTSGGSDARPRRPVARLHLRRALRAALQGRPVDADTVDKALATSHAVWPSLRAAAGRVDVADVARSSMLLVDLARTVAILDGAGIPSVVLKGGALLASGRVRPGARHCDDVDLLVAPDTAGRAFAVLEGAGFHVVEGVLQDGTLHRDRPTHQLPILKAPGGTAIELHVETHVEGETFSDVVGDAVTVDVHGDVGPVPVRVPTPARLLRQLCAHVVDHHAGELRLWPRHLFDVQACTEAGGPGGEAFHEVEHDTAVRVSLLVLAGFIDDGAPMGARALAAAVVLPPASVQRAARIGQIAVRATRAAGRGELRAMLWPDADHLRFTGDLVDDEPVMAARLARLRRLLGR